MSQPTPPSSDEMDRKWREPLSDSLSPNGIAIIGLWQSMLLVRNLIEKHGGEEALFAQMRETVLASSPGICHFREAMTEATRWVNDGLGALRRAGLTEEAR